MRWSETAELSPWVIVQDDGPTGSIALWRIDSLPAPATFQPGSDSWGGSSPGIASGQAEQGELAVALFSSFERADAYRTSQPPGSRIMQLDQTGLLRMLLAAFQQGLQYAALDPGSHHARQLFEVRDVLKAARAQLRPEAGGMSDEAL